MWLYLGIWVSVKFCKVLFIPINERRKHYFCNIKKKLRFLPYTQNIEILLYNLLGGNSNLPYKHLHILYISLNKGSMSKVGRYGVQTTLKSSNSAFNIQLEQLMYARCYLLLSYFIQIYVYIMKQCHTEFLNSSMAMISKLICWNKNWQFCHCWTSKHTTMI